jgi:hypothetical protein
MSFRVSADETLSRAADDPRRECRQSELPASVVAAVVQMTGGRRAPVTTKSTSRLPHCEHTRRRPHSGTGVSGPYQRACSLG